METHIRKIELKGKNANNKLVKIVKNFGKFTKGLKKYFENVNEIRFTEKIL